MVYTNNNIPMAPSADVTAGMLLEISGSGTVAEAATGSKKVLGTAYSDVTLLSTEKVAVITSVEVVLTDSGAGVTAGDLLKAGASSTVTTYVQGVDTEDMIIGKALDTAAASANVRVLLN